MLARQNKTGAAKRCASCRHCEERKRRSNPVFGFLDCFAEPVIGRAFARPVGSQGRRVLTDVDGIRKRSVNQAGTEGFSSAAGDEPDLSVLPQLRPDDWLKTWPLDRKVGNIRLRGWCCCFEEFCTVFFAATQGLPYCADSEILQ
jgi:hypothetical protein